MKQILLNLTILIIGLISNSVWSQSRCLERLMQEAANIDSIQFSTGTGFLINNEGYIVTNRHVIERAKELTVSLTISGKKIERKAELIGYSFYDDLAIIKIDVKNLFSTSVPYAFKKEQLNLGSKIYTLGYPDPSYMGTNIKLTDGLINATTGFQDSENEYQISAPIQGGNSGSPMFDSDGFVRGVIVASYTAGQNVNYAIKGKELVDLLDAYKIKYATNKPSLDFKTNVSAIQSRICMITNMSVKTYYREFNTTFLEKNDHSRNMMSKSSVSNSEYLDCFENNAYEAFGLFAGTKEKNWQDAIDPEKGFKTIEELLVYRSRFLNANGFNGLDAKIFMGHLYEYGAFENIMEENDNFFDFNTQEIDFSWFTDYVGPNTFNFFYDYYWAYIAQYVDYDAYKMLELNEFIDYLISVNSRFKNQAIVKDFFGKAISKVDQENWTNESFANLLQYKLHLIYLAEEHFEINDDKCELYNQIVEYLSNDKIWVDPPKCD